MKDEELKNVNEIRAKIWLNKAMKRGKIRNYKKKCLHMADQINHLSGVSEKVTDLIGKNKK